MYRILPFFFSQKRNTSYLSFVPYLVTVHEIKQFTSNTNIQSILIFANYSEKILLLPPSSCLVVYSDPPRGGGGEFCKGQGWTVLMNNRDGLYL